VTAGTHKTIGHVMAALDGCEPSARVAFDFCLFAPNGLHVLSEPGCVALGPGWLHPAQRPSVEALRKALSGAMHQQFTLRSGYAFKVSADTPLWVGEAHTDPITIVTGLEDRGDNVFLCTALVETRP
jgi:hypothetical protein